MNKRHNIFLMEIISIAIYNFVFFEK